MVDTLFVSLIGLITVDAYFAYNYEASFGGKVGLERSKFLQQLSNQTNLFQWRDIVARFFGVKKSSIRIAYGRSNLLSIPYVKNDERIRNAINDLVLCLALESNPVGENSHTRKRPKLTRAQSHNVSFSNSEISRFFS